MISPELIQQVKLLLPDKALITRYPIWKEVDGYDQRLPFDKILTFVVADHHPNSPINNIDSYIKRRKTAADIAGFDIDENGIHINLDIVLGEDPFISKCELAYIRLFNNEGFESYEVYRKEWHKLHESLALLDERSENNDKLREDTRKVTLQNIDVVKKTLRELRIELLGQDHSRMLYMSLIDDVEANMLGIAPEPIAANIKEGISPLLSHNAYERKR
jgi:hypothetical protein